MCSVLLILKEKPRSNLDVNQLYNYLKYASGYIYARKLQHRDFFYTVMVMIRVLQR